MTDMGKRYWDDVLYIKFKNGLRLLYRKNYICMYHSGSSLIPKEDSNPLL